ncbi:MAG: hypothetical protein MUP15_10405, partial [Dehalococcoidia bacterium]|nr:hypothetical protein [Dehalococcoidia bacterium]
MESRIRLLRVVGRPSRGAGFDDAEERGMRQSLILLVVLGALLVTPGCSTGTPPSPTSTPEATATPVPPVVFIGDSVTMGAFVSTPENMFVVR